MPGLKYWIDSTSFGQGARKINNGLTSIAKQAVSTGKRIASIVNPFNSLIGTVATGFGIAQLGKAGDEFVNMAAQLEYLTGNSQDAEYAQRQLYKMSQETRTGIIENSKALSRFALASEMTNLSMDQNIKVLGTINKLMLMSGTNTQEASAAMVQLGQALASGRLQGDEFRSISENAPALANELAKALQVTRGELREMSKQGELTSEIMGQAFLKIADSGTVTADKLPLTIKSMATKTFNALKNLWDKINDRTGLLSWVASGFDNLSLWIDNNINLIVHYVERFKDSLVNVIWPKIKQFFADFTNGFEFSFVKTFEKIGPLAENFFVRSIELANILIPNLRTLFSWVQNIANAFKLAYEYSKFIPIIRSSTALANSTLEAGSAIINTAIEKSNQNTNNANQNTSDTNGTTVINNFNQNISKNDIEDISTRQIIQGARL